MFLIFSQCFFVLALSLWPFGSGREGAELKKTSFEVPADPQQFELVRISVGDRMREVTLSADTAFQITDNQGNLLYQGPKINTVRLRAAATGLQVGTRSFPSDDLMIQSESGTLKVGGYKYRRAL